MLAPAGARILFVAGQVGWDRERKFADGLVAQLELALKNVLAVVRAAGGGPESIARMTVYVTDKRDYAARAKEIGERWRAVMGKRFPAMALVEVKSLLEDRALVEIEATAAIAPPSRPTTQ